MYVAYFMYPAFLFRPSILYFQCINELIFDLSKFKGCGEKKKKNVNSKLEFRKGRKHCGYQHFSPFPTMFLKTFLYRVVRSQVCVVRATRSARIRMHL